MAKTKQQLQEMTVKDLKNAAKEKGLVGYSKKPKDVVIAMLLAADGESKKDKPVSAPAATVEPVESVDLSDEGFEEEEAGSVAKPIVKVSLGVKFDLMEGPITVKDIRRTSTVRPPASAAAYVKFKAGCGDDFGVVDDDYIVQNGREVSFPKSDGSKGCWVLYLRKHPSYRGKK